MNTSLILRLLLPEVLAILQTAVKNPMSLASELTILQPVLTALNSIISANGGPAAPIVPPTTTTATTATVTNATSTLSIILRLLLPTVLEILQTTIKNPNSVATEMIYLVPVRDALSTIVAGIVAGQTAA